MNTKNTTKNLVKTAILTALTCVATMIINIPAPLKGYINIGDCFVLFIGWSLPPMYGFLAAGIGSALADVFSGYVIYAPATFIIKGTMTIISYYGFKVLQKTTTSLISQIISGTIAEMWMVIGYFLFEGFLYGFTLSAVNIPASCTQGTVGLVLGCILTRIFEKNKITLR